MQKLALSLGIIIFGILCGQSVKFSQKNKPQDRVDVLSKLLARIKDFAFLVLNPIVMINSYWVIDFASVSMFAIPFICLIVLASGGAISLFASKKLHHSDQQRASMFACGTFSNLGTIGGLITLVFLGEKAFVIAALYFLFESFYNYLFAYPMVKTLGEGKNAGKVSFWKIIKDPSIIIYVSSIFVGLALKFSTIPRPQIMADYNTYMVPVISFLLTFTISYKMEFSQIKSNKKEGLICICIKYILSPLIAVSLAFLFKLHQIEDGLILKVLIIMSMTPCGFNSIVVPTLYKADKDTANSIWILVMLSLIVVVPLEYFFLVL